MAHPITEMQCPVCKRNFIPAPYHVYMDGNTPICSYTCYIHKNDGKRPSNVKPVYQYFLDGEFLRSFDSAKEAAICVGATPKMIQECCRGITKTSAGFLWSYEKKALIDAGQSNQ